MLNDPFCAASAASCCNRAAHLATPGRILSCGIHAPPK